MDSTNGLDTLINALRSELTGSTPTIGAPSEDARGAALAIARQNKVLSLVHRQLFGSSNASSYLVEAARTLAANSVLIDQLRVLTPRLQAEEVPFVAIKGPLQQKLLYGDFYQRTAADLDILVRPSDYGRARVVLLGLGYESRTPSVWWRVVLGEEHLRQTAFPHVAVDLHHRVHQPGAPAPLDGEMLFEGVVEIDVRGVNVPTLSAPNGLLLCTISIAKALYNREPIGAHLCDLYVGLMAASPNAVNSFLTIARRVGLGGHAAVALQLLSAVFEIKIGLDHASRTLAEVPDANLRRMTFLPRDPATVWPKRRRMLWALCEQQPLRFGFELMRVIQSEAIRHAFERPLPA